MNGHPLEVPGFCPMGCGETLIIGPGGRLFCGLVDCTRPTAAHEILADGETEHVVQFSRDTFTVRHPLRERLDDALMTCQVHEHIAGLDGPPVPLGLYRAVVGADGIGALTWIPVTNGGDPS